MSAQLNHSAAVIASPVPSRGLAKPLAQVAPHYDAIVVGSGYGGGVAAARLARAGRKVCVLERGREMLPGDFRNGLTDALRELRLTGTRLRLGSPSGLFDFRVGRDLNVIVANGLGGGSLINGAVALRPEPETFARSSWPAAVAADGLLEAAYTRAERRLGVTTCPDAAQIAKFQNLARCASVIGAVAEPVPTTIRYSAGTNASNVVQYGCRLCGDCWSGCNVGAKTTVGVSYLVDAVDHGADVFTHANVRHLARDGAGWHVHVADTTPGGHGPALRVLSADMVVLAAGTLGSTEILLRSREKGLAVSAKLGQGFSANGDDMFLGLDMPSPVHGVGVGFPPRADAPAVGPGSVGMIRVPGSAGGGAVASDDAGDGASDARPLLIQDGVMLPLMAMLAPMKALTRLQPSRAVRMLVDGAYAGHRARTAMFYAVCEDDAAGRMVLERDRLVVDWPRVAEQACFKRSAEVVERMVTSLGGTFMPNPLAERMFGGRKVTVHPLGGCAMGQDAASGVVDDACRVFDAASADGRGVHAGLMVCDGSVLPGALGVNPLLTITALAERAMALLASREGWRAVDDAPTAAATHLRDALL